MNFDRHKWLDEAEKAREASQQAIRLNPEDAKGYCGLGWALYNLGKYHEAEEPLRRAVSLKADDDYAHYHLGLVLGGLNRLADSEFELLRSIQLRPEYPDAHHSLAVTYTKQRRFADAVSACLEALRLKPDYADAYFCLGAAYLKLNEQEKRLPHTLRLCALIPATCQRRQTLDSCILTLANSHKLLMFWRTQSALYRSGKPRHWSLRQISRGCMSN